MPGVAVPSLLLVLGSAGCVPVVPRAGYPWVESASVALDAEHLRIDVFADRVEVSATMRLLALRGAGGLVVGFPEDARDPPLEGLSATWRGEPVQPEPGGAAPAGFGLPPLRRVRGWHRLPLSSLDPGDAGDLVVRYRQPRGASPGPVRYLLRTGAWWRGPIRTLTIEVAGHGVHVVPSPWMGVRPVAAGSVLTWRARDVEPDVDLILEVS